MIYIKKKIYFIIASSFTLIAFSTLILFFYAAFFFEPPAVERKTEENQITKNEETSTLLIEEVEPQKEIEEVEPEKEIVKIDAPEVEVTIKDALFATVGNKAITQSDIINEIKIILILTNQSFTEDVREQLQSGAIQSTIQRNLKKIEIEKYKSLTFNPSDLEKELEKLANNLYVDLDTFENTFIANGIPFSNVVEQIQTELLWNSLIFQLYKDRLVINLDEIDEQLKLIQNKKEIEEYLISEIVLNAVTKAKLETKIKEVKNKIKTEG